MWRGVPFSVIQLADVILQMCVEDLKMAEFIDRISQVLLQESRADQTMSFCRFLRMIEDQEDFNKFTFIGNGSLCF